MPNKVIVNNLNFFYGKSQALFDNNIEIKEKKITAVIGPSGCGKSTHLRTYNRIMNYTESERNREILIDGVNILVQRRRFELREKIGIFSKNQPLSRFLFENVATRSASI